MDNPPLRINRARNRLPAAGGRLRLQMPKPSQSKRIAEIRVAEKGADKRVRFIVSTKGRDVSLFVTTPEEEGIRATLPRRTCRTLIRSLQKALDVSESISG